ncbi:hypothetical protein NHE_0878 [Neorickettsia helminthoeca str. Oregon]|uniref:Uncharacterized protein n=1 Tax=Neorickettsia helminthoeca str. Oregon TaxID=1286528 RepID=X5GXK9_9RICK|nr:hypothetical protein NHE_0878 [Neorickettsia helminthoeca str. Oregon]
MISIEEVSAAYFHCVDVEESHCDNGALLDSRNIMKMQNVDKYRSS